MRLIDADKLEERWTIPSPQPYSTDATEVLESINKQPTIEAVPVVHGEWKYENYTWHCSACEFHPFKGYIPETPGFNFCPNCGAKMEGGK